MYERGELVLVEGHGGRRAVLRVWEDRGRGLTLSSDEGYQRLLADDPDAPQVGFPRRDVRGRATYPSEPEPPSERSPDAAQD